MGQKLRQGYGQAVRLGLRLARAVTLSKFISGGGTVSERLPAKQLHNRTHGVIFRP